MKIGGNESDAFRVAKEATAEIPTKAEDASGRVIEVNTMQKAIKYTDPKGKFHKLISDYPEVLEYCEHIVGLPRNYSTHAAGVVISDIPLPDFVPIRRDKREAYSVQYEKNQVEEMGLVKMDFLGLTTLDIISETIEQARNLGMKLPSPDDLVDKTDDENAYKVIGTGLTTGCFQIEGSTLRPLCKPMKAKSIEDIAFINALGRPGCSKKERKDFLNRRDGKAPVVPPHPLLKEILAHTYGVSIYEEDLLHLAQHIAGWDLSEADGLRKVTKLKEKGAALADELEKKFIADAMERRSLSERDAQFIWEKVVIPYSKYGFNKAHAVAYSMLGYQTAYYKFYARGPFFAAVLNSKLRGSKAQDAAEKINNIKKDSKKFGVSIDVCDINRSKQYYVASEPTRIVTGLGAIKGLGDTVLDQIIARQPYASFEDFVRKNLKKVNKNHAAALAKAGAFDTLGVTRKYAHDNFAEFKEEYKKRLKKIKDETFFEAGDLSRPLPETLDGFKYSKEALKTEEWTLQEKLAFEKEVLGEYVSGSAKDLFPGFFQGSAFDCSMEEILSKSSGSRVAMEGVVTAVRELRIKKKGKNEGRTMAKLTVENLRGESIEATVWPDAYEKYREVFEQGDTPVRGTFTVNEYAGEKSLIMNADKVKVFKRK
jgi:DNA polymerase-3 subunit alpha